jgi:hypothetical protein
MRAKRRCRPVRSPAYDESFANAAAIEVLGAG